MKIKWNGSALLAPVPPVMVSCCRPGETADIVTVAWCGMISTRPPRLYISLRPSRYSHGIISDTKEFTVNLTTAAMVKSADRCGTYTGAKVNKFEKFNLTACEATEVACPLIEQSPLSLECKVINILPMGSHDMFIADIVAVDVDENLLDSSGKLHLERAGLAAFSHGEYFALGKKIGAIGFSVKKKRQG